MEPRSVIFLPAWVKFLTIGILLAAITTAAILIWRHSVVVPDRDIVNAGIALLQVSCTGLLLLMAIAFSDRDANVDMLRQRTERWLTRLLPETISRVGIPSSAAGSLGFSGDLPVSVSTSLARNKMMAHLVVKPDRAPDLTVTLFVTLNVRKLSIFVLTPTNSVQSYEMLQQAFEFPIEGARAVGYTVIFQRTKEQYLSLYIDVGNEFLTAPRDGLFWAQDVSVFIRSVIAQARQHGIILNPERLPAEA